MVKDITFGEVYKKYEKLGDRSKQGLFWYLTGCKDMSNRETLKLIGKYKKAFPERDDSK